MPAIALDSDVRAVARQLGVPLRTDPTELIVNRCMEKVGQWATELGPVTTLEELLDVVCAKLRLRFEVVSNDFELAAIQSKYLAAREFAFANLAGEFNATTDACVFRLTQAPEWSDTRYVAVVDGRGNKRYRVWFSKWHEIAHLIAEPQTKFVFRRTQAFKREPVERLMDQIAGALAFYEPLFVPPLHDQGFLSATPRIQDLARFASDEHPYASLQATLTAMIRHHPAPFILVEAKPALKVGEAAGTVPQLRAVTTTHNPAARSRRLFLHRNIRVPKTSIIYRAHGGEIGVDVVPADECLSWWESGGQHLARRGVTVDVLRTGPQRVLALMGETAGVRRRRVSRG